MTRNGTCKHTFQVQECYRFSPEETEGMRLDPERFRVVDTSDILMCEFLSNRFESLPPPIARQNGGFSIKPGDCDACPHYEPAATWNAPSGR